MSNLKSSERLALSKVEGPALSEAEGSLRMTASGASDFLRYCPETALDQDGQPKTTRFKWVTNFTVTAKRVTTLANEGGRLRWKIENEGFNVQKNGGFELEHVYSQDSTASKIFYFLLQMAHTLLQLVEHGSLFRKVFPAGVGSSKNIAARLLEAWRNVRLSLAEWEHCLTAQFQIRLDTS